MSGLVPSEAVKENLLLLPVLDINGITHYVACCAWLLSLSIMPSKFIRVVACVSASFLSGAE